MCYNQKDQYSGRVIQECKSKGISMNGTALQKKSVHLSLKIQAHRKDSTMEESATTEPSPEAVSP